MANTKISALTAGNPALSADIIPIDRAGANYSITAGSIASLAIWSGLGNPTGNLSLSNAGYTSTFNQTSAVAWLWANTTTGTVSTTNASPLLELAAQYWATGAVQGTDLWTIGSSLAAGLNGVSTLTIAHSGSTAIPVVVIPETLGFGSDSTVNIWAYGSSLLFFQFSRGDIRLYNQQDTKLYGVISGNSSGNFNIYSGTTNATMDVGSSSSYTNPFTANSRFLNLGGGSNQFQGTTNLGTQINVTETSIFSPASGSSAYVAHEINPTINQTSSASGSYTALKIAVVETALLGSANKLIDLYAGSAGATAIFSVDNLGAMYMSKAAAAAPTSSTGGGTAGILGQIVRYGGVLYFCSVGGAAGSATWNTLSMVIST
jgi:hypothetical protein